ncbi:DNA primase [bacterium]|nr:DNA primase [bacterium]
MRIPEDKIEEIRATADILTVVQEYVTLKKRGQNWFGLCPFHTEDTPSFSVNPSRGIYKCFGCNRGGNAISFLMEIERLSYVEAVRMLAERLGIELPKARAAEEGESEGDRLVRANGMARDFFHRQLLERRDTGGEQARSYLKSRGYGKEVIERYLLGYAPDSWDALAEHARGLGMPLSLLVQAGLLKEGKEKNRPYDAFRHRIVFPIRNLAGRVIGFGGRKLREDEDSPKYVNSPETAVYRKGRELFGLWEARDAIRRQSEAILVEGYTDCLSLVMAGVAITVATLGTALTEQQARLIKRFTNRVFLLYDGDEAGLSAARRAVDVLLQAGVEPRVLMLPEGEDPDSFVRARGGEEVWRLRNENALSAVDFQLRLAKRRSISLSDAARELVTSAALILSPVEQDVFLQEIAGKTRISLDALRRELSRVRPAPRTSEETLPPREKWPPPGPVSVLVRILVRRPELRAEIFQTWKPNGIPDERLSQLASLLHAEWEREAMSEPQRLLDEFPESPVREFIVDSLYEMEEADRDERALEIDRKMARDCLRSIEADRVRVEISALKEQLAKDDSAELLMQLQTLLRREKELRGRGN